MTSVPRDCTNHLKIAAGKWTFTLCPDFSGSKKTRVIPHEPYYGTYIRRLPEEGFSAGLQDSQHGLECGLRFNMVQNAPSQDEVK